LVLSGWDLSEFVKFLPGTKVTRELFFLPVWCAGVGLSLVANRRAGGIVRRVGLTAAALALMVALLPPYPHVLDGYRMPEFRWQFILGTSGTLLVLLCAWFSHRLSEKVLGGLLIVLALIGAVPPIWQFLTIRGHIEAAYGTSLGWGWGLGVFVIGWALVIAAGTSWLTQPDPGPSTSPRPEPAPALDRH
jgi:hypothetical protein